LVRGGRKLKAEVPEAPFVRTRGEAVARPKNRPLLKKGPQRVPIQNQHKALAGIERKVGPVKKTGGLDCQGGSRRQSSGRQSLGGQACAKKQWNEKEQGAPRSESRKRERSPPGSESWGEGGGLSLLLYQEANQHMRRGVVKDPFEERPETINHRCQANRLSMRAFSADDPLGAIRSS